MYMYYQGYTLKMWIGQLKLNIYMYFCCRLPIEISFTATQGQDFNFNLQCRVKRKPTPLMLNVKAQGYAINAALSYTSPDGEERSLPIGKNEKRMIIFGHVPVNERALGRISLYNNGQYAFEYRWVLSERCLMPGGGGFDKGRTLVSVDPEHGTVEPHDKNCCELAFAPPSKMTLKGCEIMLDVSIMYICTPCTCMKHACMH